MKSIVDVATDMMLLVPAEDLQQAHWLHMRLGITQVDPIQTWLLFSRFLRSDATDYPDIDYDVSDSMELKREAGRDVGRRLRCTNLKLEHTAA
jgi:hypothetical protein